MHGHGSGSTDGGSSHLIVVVCNLAGACYENYEDGDDAHENKPNCF